MKYKRVTVKKNERGILLRNGDFERVLPQFGLRAAVGTRTLDELLENKTVTRS